MNRENKQVTRKQKLLNKNTNIDIHLGRLIIVYNTANTGSNNTIL